jgi:hypothetical protein
LQNHQSKYLNISEIRGSVPYDLGCDSTLTDEGVYPTDEKVYELFYAGVCQVLMDTVFNERELGMILAGLRSIQHYTNERSVTMPYFYPDEPRPLSPDEVDELCARLNR